ncbi:unnamed protein product [Moneuplotes crassus]|uniref:DUF4215 domain-containing protein n=1 Tax=Euplotes crassus TaxID=5936 RepID=A0AAD2D4D7_EUPCR|nr:unnamed protein product [Moneuplotes crassus]
MKTPPGRSLAATCGDGTVETPEQCDDSNTISGDGCSSTCTLEAGYQWDGTEVQDICGDGLVVTRKKDYIEYCDDGNTINGDGCDSTCTKEIGYVCYGGAFDSVDSCEELCGDGIRLNGFLGNTSENYCDDGNNLSGDGCSEQCQVESGFECSGGSISSSDICTKICQVENCVQCKEDDENKCIVCENGSSMQDDLTCLKSNVTVEVKQMGQTTTAAAGAAASVAVGISALSFSSPMAIWILANQFQLFSLFLLTNANLPTDIKEYIKGNSMFSFTMEFLPFSDSVKKNGLISKFDKEQKHESLQTIGLESQSVIVNNTGFVITLILLLIVHAMISCLPRKEEEDDEQSSKAKFNKLIKKAYQIFTLGVYIRFILEAFQYLLFSCMSEIKLFNFSRTFRIISTSVAFGVLILTILFFVICIRQALQEPEVIVIVDSQRSKLDEFNAGLKKKRYVRVYSPMLLFRRYFFVIWLVFCLELSQLLIVSGMVVFQAIFVLVLLVLRPFEDKVNNIIELLNEFIFTVLLIILCQINTEKAWTGEITSLFLWTMLMNTILITFILVVSLILQLKRKCANSKEDSSPGGSNKVMNVPDISVRNISIDLTLFWPIFNNI